MTWKIRHAPKQSLLPALALLAVLFCVALSGCGAGSKAVYDDVTQYGAYRSDEKLLFFQEEGMQEIWPEAIAPEMQVENFKLVYENPFDANYLGMLTVTYDAAAYGKEIQRLKTYQSTDYEGIYEATEFAADKTLLAMHASDSGFVYALGEGTDKIIYIELFFPGYAMDLDYTKYISQAYLPQGLNIAKGNPTQEMRMNQIKERTT